MVKSLTVYEILSFGRDEASVLSHALTQILNGVLFSDHTPLLGLIQRKLKYMENSEIKQKLS